MDIFGQAINLNYPDGEPEYKTLFGSLLTLFVNFVGLVFFAQSMYVMFARLDVNIV